MLQVNGYVQSIVELQSPRREKLWASQDPIAFAIVLFSHCDMNRAKQSRHNGTEAGGKGFGQCCTSMVLSTKY